MQGISHVHSADSTPPCRVIRQGSPERHHLTLCDAGLIIWRREDGAQQVYHPLITRLRHARLSPHHGEGCRNSLNGAASSTPESSTRRRQLADWLEVWPRRICPRARDCCTSERIRKPLHCLDCLKKLAMEFSNTTTAIFIQPTKEPREKRYLY